MKRREFLKGSGKLMAGSALASMFGIEAFASEKGNPVTNKLIVIFNYGANDGLNMLVPYGDANYYVHRPTLGVDVKKVLKLGDKGKIKGKDFFGLHPAMNGLKNIWDKNNVAFIPAMHCGKKANRSHFFNFKFQGAGKYMGDSKSKIDGKGWIGRYMYNKYNADDSEAVYKPNGLQAFDFTSGSTNVFDGCETLGLVDPSRTYYGSGDAKKYIEQVSKAEHSENNMTQQIMQLRNSTVESMDNIAKINFEANTTTAYPNSRLGMQLKQTASLLKNNKELEIVYLNKGGWDTHSDQANRHTKLLKDLSDSLEAFYNDENVNMDNITVLVMSEFGRTVQQNNSKDDNGKPIPGTDHGRASCAIVMGGKVEGGIYGEWPGLDAEKELDEGRFLKETVSYRDVITECLSTLDNTTYNNPSAFGEGYTPKNALGFIDENS